MYGVTSAEREDGSGGRHGHKSEGRHDCSASRSTGKDRLAIGNPVSVTHGRTLGCAGRAAMAAMATPLTHWGGTTAGGFLPLL
jgi:hypothetical protein